MKAHTTTKILTIAAQAHGICTRAALLERGISRSAIDRRLADGTLVPVCAGVYEAPLFTDDVTPLVRATTAVPGSALSRRTAATIHRFQLPATPGVHVTANKGTGWSLPGTVIHESRALPTVDIVTSPDGLPVTSTARTMVDLAGELSPQRLRHLVRTQVADDAPAIDDLQRCFARLARRGRPGVRSLRLILEDFDEGAAPIPQSELELRVWNGLRLHGPRGFALQFRPPWFDGQRGIVDFAHEDAAVILEADGRRWHARHEAMVEDRRRDRTAAASGWVVVRVMWEDIVERPEGTFDDLSRIVDTRLAQRAA